MRSPFVICGATGNVGFKIAGRLLGAGEPVRVIGRERVRLGPLAAKGAEPWPGDLGDAATENTTPTTMEEFASTVFANAYRTAA